MAYQQGSIYLRKGAWHLKYRTTELKNGTPERVHKTVRLCAKNGQQHHKLCTQKGEHRTKKSVEGVWDSVMQEVRAAQGERNPEQDMPVSVFWETRFVPYCEEIMKTGPRAGQSRKRPSTMRGYQQIWRQHLKAHFGVISLQEYEPRVGRQFLRSLTAKQGKTTLKHIKAVACSIFKLAVDDEKIKVNPWHDVGMPDDAVASESTKHYTLAEAEDMVSALVDHVDCQLIVALSCFLGLRPGEIAALKWEDFDSENVHIRRAVVRGHVDIPKTKESIAPLPLIDQVRVPLELWRQKSGKSEGYVFESRNGTPVDLHNVISRIIIPHVNGGRNCVPCDKTPEASGVTWKGLYAGRRGACTATIEATGGNYAIAQALLRHKSMTTTLNVYKKQITPDAFKAGMKLLQAAASNSKQSQGETN